MSATTLAFGNFAATITQDIGASRTLYADTAYTISGFIHVLNGATLTIEPGTIIKGDYNVLGSSLLIMRGARLNAIGTAENLGLRFTESRVPGPTEFVDLIAVEVGSGDNKAVISGSFFGGHPRIVKINGRRVEATPEGTLLLLENDDRPGMIGSYGTILGKHQVNIANMSLSRNVEGGTALTLLTLDSTPPQEVIQELEKLPGVKRVYCMELE